MSDMHNNDGLRLALVTGVNRNRRPDAPHSKHWTQAAATWGQVCGRTPVPGSTKQTVVEEVLGTLSTTPACGSDNCNGLHRVDSAVESRSAIVLDYDDLGGPDGAAALLEALISLGVEALAFTSSSSTPELPRYQVIVPTGREMTADEYRALSQWLWESLGVDGVDRACRKPSQKAYRPAGTAVHHEKTRVRGPLLDVDDTLAGIGGLEAVLEVQGEAARAARAAGLEWDGEVPASPVDWDTLTPEQQAQGRAECEHRLAYWKTKLASRLDWDDRQRDDKDRGWEGLCRDFAWNLAIMVASGWYGMDVDDAAQAYEDTLPDAMLDIPELEQKWRGQELVDKVLAQGRCEPAQWSDAASDFGPGLFEGEDLIGHGEVPAMTEAERHDIGNDHRMGRRLAQEYLDQHFRAWGTSSWARWDGKRWDIGCTLDEVNGVAQTALIDIQTREIALADARRDERLARGESQDTVLKRHRDEVKLCLRLRSKKVLDDIRTSARPWIRVAMQDFDGPRTAWLLNTQNGVVNLRTGELGPHDRSLLITKIAGVAYKPEAASEDWEKLKSALPNGVGVREWAQKWYGRGIVAAKPADQSVLYMSGSGDNGKSTFLAALAWAAGDYAVVASDKILTGSSSDHSTEFMPLRGARMAWIEELPDGDWITGTAVKKAEGPASGMTARLMRENLVTWTPTHSLIFSSNNPIQVTDTDHGTRRRLVKLTFPWKFGEPGMPRDPALEPKVTGKTEPAIAEAALAWLVAGAVAGRDGEGLQKEDRPADVVRDTEEWLASVNPAEAFAAECLERTEDEDDLLLGRHVYMAYTSWCKARGRKPLGDQKFWQAMKTTPLMRDVTVDKRPVQIAARHRGEGLPGVGRVVASLTGVKWTATWAAEDAGW